MTDLKLSDARRIPQKEAAKIARQSLKKRYPGVKFWVRMGDGSGIDIYWIDGPSLDEVEAAHDYGSIFGMDITDYAYSGYHWLMPDGTTSPAYCSGATGVNEKEYPAPSPAAELVMFYSNYTHYHRNLSPEAAKTLLGNLPNYPDHTPQVKEKEWKNWKANSTRGIIADFGIVEHEYRPYCDYCAGLWRAYRKAARETSFIADKKTASVDTLTIENSGDWTWIFFPTKPPASVRDILKDRYNARWSKKRKGWYIKDTVSAEELENALQFTPPQQGTTKPGYLQDQKIADRLRQLADNMQKTIDHKLAPRLENTWKRQNEAQHQREDGWELQRVQKAMRALADKWEDGTMPESWAHLKTKKAVTEAVQPWGNAHMHAIRDIGEGVAPSKAEQELTEKINKAKLIKIEGYFPTPDAIIDRMLDHVNIEEGTKALEPSAGSGNIADRLRDLGAQVDIIEPVTLLRDILELKGYTLNGYDIMEHTKSGYDAIVMNPPFERNQDCEHVQKAYDLLAPGGELVSIMSPTFTFSDKGAPARFAEWLDEVGGWYEELPADSFKESGTSINTVMVVIQKADAPQTQPNAQDQEPEAQPEEAPEPVQPELNLLWDAFDQAVSAKDAHAFRNAVNALKQHTAQDLDCEPLPPMPEICLEIDPEPVNAPAV